MTRIWLRDAVAAAMVGGAFMPSSVAMGGTSGGDLYSWSSHTFTNPVSGEITDVLLVHALGDGANFISDVTLFLECQDGIPYLGLKANATFPPRNSDKIDYRIDAAPPNRASARPVGDGNILINSEVSLMRSLFGAKKLAVELHPDDNRVITAVFDIHGLTAQLSKGFSTRCPSLAP